ncbi:hypothetical protein B0H16DRAFT_1607441, partial [Mycena metata]
MPHPRGYAWIGEALGAGLLVAIVTCAAKCKPPAREHLEYLLEKLLPGALVYHSILTHLDKALSDVDSLKCGAIHGKQKFRCCSGCLQVYYCSNACQASDWKVGGHRNACVGLRKLDSDEYEDLPSNARDRSFLRALLHHDYTTMKADVLCQQLLFRSRPQSDNFYTVFSYVEGHVTFKVQAGQHESINTMWPGYIRRASGSAGKMVLHLIFSGTEAGAQLRMIPLRSPNSKLYQEMRALGKEIESRR